MTNYSAARGLGLGLGDQSEEFFDKNCGMAPFGCMLRNPGSGESVEFDLSPAPPARPPKKHWLSHTSILTARSLSSYSFGSPASLLAKEMITVSEVGELSFERVVSFSPVQILKL